ncbi:Peroxisome biosynthesis protein pex1 [Ascosphaera atra]|nr:Peroxisome biosynthesis protein pex1 [Ascosphaera atra]
MITFDSYRLGKYVAPKVANKTQECANPVPVIELHATFLEINFLSQIRALPNPAYSPPSGTKTHHPLTLHLSPTSTANITVTGLTPAPPSKVPFAKVGPEAEVIVAPKIERPIAEAHMVYRLNN